jgi:fatty-acid desaturase
MNADEITVLGSMAVQGPVMSWVADHRKHHAFTDEDGDPHSLRHQAEIARTVTVGDAFWTGPRDEALLLETGMLGVFMALDVALSRAAAVVIVAVVLVWFLLLWYVLPLFVRQTSNDREG